MSVPGALHSDHINYLILRYLQEAGHERTAKAFHRDWHRPRDYRDPEDFPFAATVSRHELISVVQSGLSYDELQARVGRNERRFRWTDVNTRESVEQGDSNAGTEEDSRPGSAPEKRKGRATGSAGAMRAPDEFPTPAAKRQRVSHGPDGVQVNGDAMEVDAQSASAADVDDDASMASPAVASEDAMEVPVERYDSLDVATQTDVRVGPKTSTMNFAISKPGARILLSQWSPDSGSKDRSTLLTVGDHLCRYYGVPNSLDGDVGTIEHFDQSSIAPDSGITAMAWHPEGHTATIAVDSVRHLPGTPRSTEQVLMDIGRDYGPVYFPPGPDVLDPPGITLCIRYSPDGEYVLVLQTNLKRGSAHIYKTKPNAKKPHLRTEPVAWRTFEHQSLDAAWCGPNAFFVCGERGLLSEFTLDLEQEDAEAENITAEKMAIHGLRELLNPNNGQEDKKGTWDKIRFDNTVGLVVCTSDEDLMYTGTPQNDRREDDRLPVNSTREIQSGLTGLAFQPRPNVPGTEPPSSTLLAMSFEDGTCSLHTMSLNASGSLETYELCWLRMDESPALALEWSPDGEYLAIAGTDEVRIWRPKTDGSFDHRRPLVTWRAASNGALPENGEANGGHAFLCEPALSWDASGERLCFARDTQVSIISIRPPTAPTSDHEGTNGHEDP